MTPFGINRAFAVRTKTSVCERALGGRGFACRPCYDGRDFAPCQHNGCMHQVTVADALAELDRLLDERDRGLQTPWRVVEPSLGPEIDALVSIKRVSEAE